MVQKDRLTTLDTLEHISHNLHEHCTRAECPILLWSHGSYDMIHLTAIWLTPCGSRTHLHTNNTRTTQSTQNNTQNNTINTWNNTTKEECGPWPVFARYTLAFALQLRKKHGKTSVRVENGPFLVISRDSVWKIWCSHRWQYKTLYALCMQDNLLYRHTLRICISSCFSTAKLVARTRLNFRFLRVLTNLSKNYMWVRSKFKTQKY